MIITTNQQRACAAAIRPHTPARWEVWIGTRARIAECNKASRPERIPMSNFQENLIAALAVLLLITGEGIAQYIGEALTGPQQTQTED